MTYTLNLPPGRLTELANYIRATEACRSAASAGCKYMLLRPTASSIAVSFHVERGDQGCWSPIDPTPAIKKATRKPPSQYEQEWIKELA